MRTSLYADDAAIFMAPIKRDVDNLSAILRGSGKVTGLCTNFHKSSVVPATRAMFPIKYLGLPLSVRQLRKVDFQYLEDKAAEKLVTWEGQTITTIGRTALVRSVITSQVVFSITPLIVP